MTSFKRPGCVDLDRIGEVDADDGIAEHRRVVGVENALQGGEDRVVRAGHLSTPAWVVKQAAMQPSSGTTRAACASAAGQPRQALLAAAAPALLAAANAVGEPDRSAAAGGHEQQGSVEQGASRDVRHGASSLSDAGTLTGEQPRKNPPQLDTDGSACYDRANAATATPDRSAWSGDHLPGL